MMSKITIHLPPHYIMLNVSSAINLGNKAQDCRSCTLRPLNQSKEEDVVRNGNQIKVWMRKQEK